MTMLLQDHDRLRRHRAKLMIALDFYANPETYFAIAVLADPPNGDFMDDFSEEEAPWGSRRFPGKLARETIEEIINDMNSAEIQEIDRWEEEWGQTDQRKSPERRESTRTITLGEITKSAQALKESISELSQTALSTAHSLSSKMADLERLSVETQLDELKRTVKRLNNNEALLKLIREREQAQESHEKRYEHEDPYTY